MSTRLLDTIIVVGAGEGADLERQAGEADRLILVEPRSEAAEALKRAAEGQENVTIVQAAIAADTTERTFVRRNLPDASGFNAPAALKELYPGLGNEAEDTLIPQDIVSFLGSRISGDLSGVRLVLDVNGEECALIEALGASGLLTALGELEVHCGTRALFEGGATADWVISRFSEAGFEAGLVGAGLNRIVRARRNSAEPAQDSVQSKPALGQTPVSPSSEGESDRIAALSHALYDQRRARTAVEQANRELKARLGEAERRAERHAEALNQLEEQFEQVSLASEAQAAILAEERDKLSNITATLEAELDKAGRDVAQAEKALQAERGRTSAAKRRANGLERKLKAVEAERDEAHDALKASQAEVAAVQASRERLQADLKAVQAQRDDALSILQSVRSGLEEAERQRESRSAELKAARVELESVQAALEQAGADKNAAQKELSELKDLASERHREHVAELSVLEARLSKERDEAVMERDAARREVEALQSEAHEAGEQNESLRAELKEMCDYAGREANKRASADEAAASVQSRVDTLRRELEGVRSAAEQAESKLNSVRREADERARSDGEKLDALRARIEDLQSSHQGELDRMRSQIENESNQSLAAARREREEARTECDRAKEDLSIAVRAQTLAQADLRSLQAEYRDLLMLKESQDDLLAKLVARLGDAAAYLQTPALDDGQQSESMPKSSTTAQGRKRGKGSGSNEASE
ncbi:hypothetical protein NHF40_02035 [Maricaulaceae bacterium EIL42A08]|nr:hypothetical protein [Maricaulaceae bacterium EIL42A08]